MVYIIMEKKEHNQLTREESIKKKKMSQPTLTITKNPLCWYDQ
jgi:hypothetical protein